MSAIFKAIRCSACSGLHDVYVAESVVSKRRHEFTCPTRGERVPLGPRGKVFRHVDVVPPAAVLATVSNAARD